MLVSDQYAVSPAEGIGTIMCGATPIWRRSALGGGVRALIVPLLDKIGIIRRVWKDVPAPLAQVPAMTQ